MGLRVPFPFSFYEVHENLLCTYILSYLARMLHVYLLYICINFQSTKARIREGESDLFNPLQIHHH